MSELMGEPSLTASAGFLSLDSVPFWPFGPAQGNVCARVEVCADVCACGGMFRHKLEVTAARNFCSCVFAGHLLCAGHRAICQQRAEATPSWV